MDIVAKILRSIRAGAAGFSSVGRGCIRAVYCRGLVDIPAAGYAPVRYAAMMRELKNAGVAGTLLRKATNRPDHQMPKQGEATPMPRCIAAAIALLLTSSSLLNADGGVTIAQIDRDDLRVTVFAAPVPVRAGLLAVSFLVQEIPSNQPVGEAGISCSVRKLSLPSHESVRLPAWCSAITPGTRIPAIAGHSGNKLLSGAYVPIPEAGRWELSVHMAGTRGDYTATVPLDVSPPLPPFSTWWPVIALVPCAILLYAWRACLLCASRRRGFR